MKNLLFPAFVMIFLFLACKNSENKEQQKENVQQEEHTPTTTRICFLTTGRDIQREDRVIRDSTILTLQVIGKKVTGKFNWFPAEKDGRSGTLEGILNDNVIKGKYTFMQEGMTETQPIRIQLTEQRAKITTNPGQQGEFVLTAEKVSCNN